jgi:hypothetical protein
MKNKKLIHINGFGSDISFENKNLFYRFPEDTNARKIFLFKKIKLPNNYEIISVDKDDDGNEIWTLEKCDTEIRIQNYPFDLKFYVRNKFENTPEDSNLRNQLLVDKVGPNYKIESVVKKVSGEVWWVTSNDKEEYYSKSIYKITIRDYPCTFNFDVRRKFKPFSEDNDDGRSYLLLSKMYEKRIKTNGHTYEDYVIENVEYWENLEYGGSGEIWTLGS